MWELEYDSDGINIYLQIPWIHMNEFSFCFQSSYFGCFDSHNPVLAWCFLQALLWLVDGSEGFNHFMYFSIMDVPLSYLTCAKNIPRLLEAVALLTMMLIFQSYWYLLFAFYILSAMFIIKGHIHTPPPGWMSHRDGLFVVRASDIIFPWSSRASEMSNNRHSRAIVEDEDTMMMVEVGR